MAAAESFHVDLALPKAADPSFFNETQWRVLFSVMDALIPSIVSETDEASRKGQAYTLTEAGFEDLYAAARKKATTTPEREVFRSYLAERISENQDFRDYLATTLSRLPADARGPLGTMLSILSSRWGSFLMTGHFEPFDTLSLEAREAVIQGWQRSRLGACRAFAKGVGGMGQKVWSQTSPLYRQLSGWTDLPADYEATKPPSPPVPEEYRFEQFPAGGEAAVIETDIVIVGSGCGGGVCAKVLAEAGHRVTVVDKGYYFPPSQLPMRSEVGETYLFENGGLLPTDDGSMSVLAGSTWGGGGSVNWGVSLRTPDYVRAEWAGRRGLSFFAGPEFDQSLDRVCEFMGVSDGPVRQNHRGQVLLDGARRRGWRAKPTPHNSGGRPHDCGHCHLGCGSSGKQGPAVSWLPAAARAGARFIEGFEVDRVTLADFASGRKATGVVGRWTSRDREGMLSGPDGERTTRQVEIRARRVILSSGTLWSPVLLKKSGLSNPNIGRNTYLHPVNCVGAFYTQETKPWEGCAITSVCTAFEDLDNEGHGTKLEPLCMVPFLIAANMPWRGAVDFKTAALRYRHMGTWFSMPRERDTGRVYPDPRTGRPRVEYTPSAYDRAHGLEGLIALCRVCYEGDAVEIRPFLPNVEPFVREEEEAEVGENDDGGGGGGSSERSAAERARFEAWLGRVRAAGNPVDAPWGCAHQMGSCRMSATAEDGVVDPRGKVWGVEGLYVADASVFPSASGVNPMVTNMAISDRTARGISADLKAMQ